MKKEEEKRMTEEDKPLEAGEEAADAGQEDMERDEKSPADKMSWEEILSDPEYRQQYDSAVQSIVKKRLRERQSAEENLARLAPVLEALGEVYKTDIRPDTLDAQALAARILDGAKRHEPETDSILSHLEILLGQADELKESFPEFDLMRELEDPAFLRLTAPHTGVGLSDAYYALHRDEIGRSAARSSLEALSRSLRTSGMRPRELTDTRAAADFSYDPRTMSREEREALKKRIYEAKAKGIKLSP